MTSTRGLDWRALLSQPSTSVPISKRSPFAPKQQNGPSTPQAQTTPKAATGAQATEAEQQQEYVVPILLSKVAVQHIPEAKPDHCQEPQQHLQKLQELQRQTSSLLAAVAELAKKGQGKEQQRQAGVAATPSLKLPVTPPEHDAEEGCYYWTGSRTSPYSEAASAGTAVVAQGSNARHRADDSSSLGPGTGVASAGVAGGSGSMDTSATTRVLASTTAGGPSDMFSTARSPAQTWGDALAKLKQLQLQTQEALEG